MPHDANGIEVKAGDRVIVECTVRDVQPGEDYCNVTLSTLVPMKPSGTETLIVLNAGQCVLQEDPPSDA